ncbi:putative zinc-binding dehydrogenase family oxidoreductase [Aspergillus sclerotioniger CBS 115572]|uniref:Putative zinc-binding dehydrogenase family oxidoreductase n=1 Tax=Aspergillus sclerotioniger CBS 115572 TaxID=1450535 RepID=A0A317XC74_9EURO|nr:putative zinc-binding dehydrogenase family oxidoreductase [Aspergillus sclerotioniger CBS 115572]PWY96196.1 putative zinc-binding dehydrogenase family oxidoreductase [Aspergillus sclerotioniger CBS 115572]
MEQLIPIEQTMATNTALVVRVAVGQPPKLSKEDIPRPSPTANQVLVKLSHVAQNPTDVQAFDSNVFGEGAVLGCAFVGEVIELGSDVTRLAEGDVAAGLVWGGEAKGLGAYSQYCLADERISFKIPGNVSRAHASTIPLAAATAWLALFSKDCLALDRTQAKGTSVLVWGGSSSVGLYTIQLASIFGFDVVTTCSPKHSDLARSYGARHVFDYKNSDVAEKIREVAPSLGHASKEDHKLATELFENLPAWLEKGTIKPNNPKVLAGSDAVADGFQEYRDGKVSAYKIVYEL